MFLGEQSQGEVEKRHRYDSHTGLLLPHSSLTFAQSRAITRSYAASTCFIRFRFSLAPNAYALDGLVFAFTVPLYDVLIPRDNDEVVLRVCRSKLVVLFLRGDESRCTCSP
jgi:hypothetical protein